jgi:hypothetical protein
LHGLFGGRWITPLSTGKAMPLPGQHRNARPGRASTGRTSGLRLRITRWMPCIHEPSRAPHARQQGTVAIAGVRLHLLAMIAVPLACQQVCYQLAEEDGRTRSRRSAAGSATEIANETGRERVRRTQRRTKNGPPDSGPHQPDGRARQRRRRHASYVSLAQRRPGSRATSGCGPDADGDHGAITPTHIKGFARRPFADARSMREFPLLSGRGQRLSKAAADRRRHMEPQ